MPDNLSLFLLATTLLMLTPGPNVALIVANAVAHGARHGLLTVLGTTLATVLHLVVVGIGLGSVLGELGSVLEWLRWIGVAYLLLIGIQAWRAPPDDLTRIRAQAGAPLRMVGRALLVSLTNPKLLLFYGAFFPPFIAQGRPIGPQVTVLCVAFVLIAATVDAAWALAAARARPLLAAHGRLRQRISGGVLIGAGAVLAVARPR